MKKKLSVTKGPVDSTYGPLVSEREVNCISLGPTGDMTNHAALFSYVTGWRHRRDLERDADRKRAVELQDAVTQTEAGNAHEDPP
eukprot:11188337-Alexandrium_andersonii.AAC.1